MIFLKNYKKYLLNTVQLSGRMKTGSRSDKTCYKDYMSPVKRTSHAVYDLKYHLVWVPKYRKMILKGGEVAKRIREVFAEIAERYEFEIDTMEVKKDHVHLFLSAPPRYSPAGVV